MATLELKYWPEGNKNGFSSWRLARKDNEKAEFPCNEDILRLSRRFIPHGEIAIERRLDTCCILTLAICLNKKSREAFLKAIEERMLQ